MRHKDAPIQEIHHPFSFSFADEIERQQQTVVTTDLWKFAVQRSNYTIWWLTSIQPVTWVNVLIAGAGSAPSGPAGGALIGNYPNPNVAQDSHQHTPGISIPTYPTNLPPSGPAGGVLSGNYPNPSFSNTTVIPGTYTRPTVTVDEFGRVTTIVENPSVSLNNLELTGIPTAVTAAINNNSNQLANTSFVTSALARLNNSITTNLTSGLTKLNVGVSEQLNIVQGFQKLVYGSYTVEGSLRIQGQLVILAGTPDCQATNTLVDFIAAHCQKILIGPIIINSPVYIYGLLRII